MAISIMDKLRRLLSKQFRKVEKTAKAIKVYPKPGRFSRRDWDKATRIADRYDANVSGIGYIQVTKKRGHAGQNSALNQGRKRARPPRQR